MKYRTLGKTGLEVSGVSVGMWAIGGDAWGPVEDADSLAAIRRAWELGVNFYDTADVYGRGRSERILAQLISDVPREQIVIATKVGLWLAGGERPNPYTEPQMIIDDCVASLKRLGIETIDVYQCHLWFDENVEVFAEAFLKLKEQGKIRFAGVSTNDFLHLKHFDSGEIIDRNTFLKVGLLKKAKAVKLLGEGDISYPLKIKVDKVSQAAKEKIESAGGKVEIG